ncbi:hypothetical protein ACG02S_01025 [Roseateles sp. DC23W]|uniref:Uncharacterized protein n=1 Tax=Pelomonas dachongensis TaxID=3299029 RepID=A0ABW7EI73_9BURK
MLGRPCGAVMLVALLQGTAHAGTVYQSAIVASPQMQVRDGQTDGCGFQLKSLPTSLAGEKSAVVLDVSLNLYSSYLALMKGGAVELGVSGGKPMARKALPITAFWLKASGGRATVPRENKVIPGEDPGYLLYGADFALVAELFYAVIEGKQLSLGVKVKGESVERIYVGVPQIEDAEKNQSHQCMTELPERMKALIKEEPR